MHVSPVRASAQTESADEIFDFDFIEIAGPAGKDINGYRLLLFNGLFGTVYESRTLTGLIPDQQNGFGTVAIPFTDIESPGTFSRGIGLVDENNNPLQLIRYVVMTIVLPD